MTGITLSAKKAIYVLGAIIAMATAAFAAPDPFDYHCADIAYMQNKAVQKELGVTEPQRARMNKHADTHRAKMAAYDAELQALAKKTKKQVQPDRNKVMGFYATLKKEVLSEMSAAQIKRLRELTLQFLGLQGMLDGEVAKRLGITTPTLTKLRNTFSAGFTKVANMKAEARNKILKPYIDKKPKDQTQANQWKADIEKQAAAAQKRLMPQIKQIEQQTEKSILAMLTPAQKTGYQALQGKLFKPQK